MDTHSLTNIEAEGATIANVGSNQQITYTIFPNMEMDIAISVEVKDFGIDGIAINGMRMDLSMEIDDAVLQEKVDKVVNAVDDLDKGAGELNDGARTFMTQ